MIFRGTFPDVEIPQTSLTPFVLRRAAELRDRPAIIDGPSGRTLTYGQLSDAIRLAQIGWARRGLEKGQTVAIYSPNLPEYAVAFHSVVSAGGVVTTANPLFTEGELATQLGSSSARFLITVPPLLERARAAALRAGVEEVFVFGEAEGATRFASLLEQPGQPPRVQIDPAADLAVLPYSSGTTGLPKGVMLTHRNLVANLVQCTVAEAPDERDTLLAILPFYHIYGMTMLMNLALHVGATIVTMPRFDLEQFLETLQRYRITIAYLVPPIVLALAKHPLVDRYDLSSVRAIWSGAAPLGPEVARAAGERVGCSVRQGYGLTETSPVTHRNLSFDRPGSIGQLVPNTECKIVDLATGRELGPGETGELCIRGPQVMKGYLNDPGATAASIDSAGWLHTGDVGYADDDGYFYVVDRAKEMIKYKGYQVAPAELEAILLAHPAVADAAVIPVPDEEAGEIPKAFVAARSAVSPEELVEFVATRVAPFKRIRQVEVVDEIPKSASGKILRRVLIERERARVATAG